MGRIHPNVLKLKKQKRQGRRAYLTNIYSVMKVPRAIGMGAIADHVKTKDALKTAEKLFDYRARAVINPDLEGYFNAIFPGILQTSERRKYCLDRAEEENLKAFVTDTDICDYITMIDSKIQAKRITMVFNRKKTRVYFLEINYRPNGCSYIMKSKTYGDEGRALFDFNHKRVSWIEFLELSSLELVLPRRGT